MKKLLFILLIMNISSPGFSQGRNAYGRVINHDDQKSVEGAIIVVLNTELKTTTDSAGSFRLNIPKGEHHLLINHLDFETKKLTLAGPYWTRPINIEMIPVNYVLKHKIQIDSLWCKKKNIISVMPFEIIIGSVGLQYERLLGSRQSIGLHSSFYVFGWGYSINNVPEAINKYNGFKVSPFYRYYPNRKANKSFFVEGQLTLGYFKMNPLLYRYYIMDDWDDYHHITIGKSINFSSVGIGTAVGWAIKISKTKYGIFNFSMGLQYFPLNVPENITDYKYYEGHYYGNFTANKTWWYLGGPGSVLQVRLAYGRMF